MNPSSKPTQADPPETLHHESCHVRHGGACICGLSFSADDLARWADNWVLVNRSVVLAYGTGEQIPANQEWILNTARHLELIAVKIRESAHQAAEITRLTQSANQHFELRVQAELRADAAERRERTAFEAGQQRANLLRDAVCAILSATGAVPRQIPRLANDALARDNELIDAYTVSQARAQTQEPTP